MQFEFRISIRSYYECDVKYDFSDFREEINRSSIKKLNSIGFS